MPVPKVRNIPDPTLGATPLTAGMGGPSDSTAPDDTQPATHVTPSNAAPTGSVPNADPLETLKAYLAAQHGSPTPTPVLPRPIDPSVFQQTQKNLSLAALVHSTSGIHTPNWYEVQHGKGRPIDVDPEGSRLMEEAARAPLQQAMMMRGMDMDTAKVLNDFAEREANRQNTFDVGKMHAGASALMIPARTAADVEKTRQEAPIKVQTAADTAAATAPQKVKNAVDIAKATEDTKVDTAGRIAAKTAPIHVEAGKAKIPGGEATNVNKAEEIINRAQQTKELLHKYGNLGPLMQYGTAPAAVLRSLHMDSPVTDASGRSVPAAELADDANELQGHITYLTKEAPRVLAAGGRMDLNSIKALGHTFPGATDSEASGTKKLDMYGHHAYEWIRKTDAAHAGAVRRDIYGGGKLPGEEAYGGEAIPTGGRKTVQHKVINGKGYTNKGDGWEED